MEWMWAAMGAADGGRDGQTDTAGYSKAFAGSDGSNDIWDYVWYKDSDNAAHGADSRTHEVGKKKPNELGLFDMSGNVWEWCWDWYGGYPEGRPTNYTGAASGLYRVVRGGAWSVIASSCAVTFRTYGNLGGRGNDVGFRVVCR
jgi:formylglycine-generating enzyme required for sulfatase activity